MSVSLAGTVIAVTGAQSGYGRDLSVALAAAGATVVLLGTNAEALSGLASHIELRGGQAIPMQADSRQAAELRRAGRTVDEVFGGLHGVVHLADKRARGDVTAGEWNDLYEYNIRSTYNVLQGLRLRGGRVWLILVGPHADEAGVHAAAQRGAMAAICEHGQEYALRANLVIPARAHGGEAASRPLVQTVLHLADPALAHVSGLTIPVRDPTEQPTSPQPARRQPADMARMVR